MIKAEIKNFLVDAGENREIPVALPASVYQAVGDVECNTVRMYATVNADAIMLGGKYIYLRINDLRHSAAVSLNGHAIGMPTAEEPYYCYDIKDRLKLGENLLEITFEGEPSELLSAGIFGGVELIRFENQMIEGLFVESSRDGGDVVVSISLNTAGSPDAVRAVATLVSGSGQIYYAGLTKGRGRITVKDPLLWWPKGVGIQNLYKLTVNLYGESEIEDTAEIRIGFASLTTDGGTTEVNGEPFIPLGVRYSDVGELTPERERAAIGAYLGALYQAGVNTIVIPEDVPRISDTLYDLCDLYGIVTVHEMTEVKPLIRSRLMYQGYRPSVGMIDLIGDGDELESVTETLRRVCHKADVNCHKATEYTAVYSLPTERTINELVPEGERNPFSMTLDPIRADILKMIADASEEYPYASDLKSLSYVTGLSAARRCERALISDRVASRRAIFDSHIRGGGLLSSGALDSAYRRCALYYHLARSFAGTALFAVGDGGKLDFYVARSERREMSGTVELRIFDRSGESFYTECVEVTAAPTAVTRIFTRDFADALKGRERNLYLEYILRDETGVLSKRTHLFCEIRKYKFTKPRIETEIVGTDKRFAMTIGTDVFAAGVEVSFDMDGVFLSDNYFDLGGGAKHKIVINTMKSTSKELLFEAMKIRTVNDIALK